MMKCWYANGHSETKVSHGGFANWRKKKNITAGFEAQLHLISKAWALKSFHCPFPCRCNFYLFSLFISSLSLSSCCSSSEHCHCKLNGLRCTKTDLKTHKRQGKRVAPEAMMVAAVAFGIFLLSFFSTCPTDIQGEMQLPQSKVPQKFMFASLKTTLSVR